MKKLLLALLFSVSMFSQETFVKKYTSYVSQSKGVMQPWGSKRIPTRKYHINKTTSTYETFNIYHNAFLHDIPWTK